MAMMPLGGTAALRLTAAGTKRLSAVASVAKLGSLRYTLTMMPNPGSGSVGARAAHPPLLRPPPPDAATTNSTAVNITHGTLACRDRGFHLCSCGGSGCC